MLGDVIQRCPGAHRVSPGRLWQIATQDKQRFAHPSRKVVGADGSLDQGAAHVQSWTTWCGLLGGLSGNGDNHPLTLTKNGNYLLLQAWCAGEDYWIAFGCRVAEGSVQEWAGREVEVWTAISDGG